MSTITPISRPLPGEHVAALSPGNATAAATDWLRRPNLYPGRALTAPTLEGRQRWQAGRIAQRGQSFTPGTVRGLEVGQRIEPAPENGGDGTLHLVIEPGHALAASGEDVLLPRRLEFRLADLPVVAPPAWFVEEGEAPAPGDGSADALAAEPNPREIGRAPLGATIASAGARMSRIGIVLLQPVEVDVAEFDADDPCDRCACDDADNRAAFEDWRIGDGARVLWYPWPEEWRPLPATVLQLRNALAHGIFEAEAELPAGGVLPWQAWGAPLALLQLDEAQPLAVAPVFIDRAAVTRQGGRAREPRLQWQPIPPAQSEGDSLRQRKLQSASRLPALWQARIEQFAEQLIELGDPAPPLAELSTPFRRLPPCGLLPKSALDLATFRSDFFGPLVTLDAVPVPLEQLDVAIADAAPLATLDLSAPERVRLLVPVTQASWEPRLLHREVIDPEFQQTLDRFLLSRARELGARQGLRHEVALLGRTLSGQPQTVAAFDDDPQAVEVETLTPWGPPPEGGGHRGARRSGIHQHFFDSATETLTPAAGESLYAWVCLDPAAPPRTLMLQWRVGTDWEHRAIWGEDLIPWGAADSAAHRLIGDLPESGRWLKLEVPAATLGLGGQAINGMAFTLYDGQAAFGMTGAKTGNAERKWFCNVLPAGARRQGDEPWELLTGNDLWAPFEAAQGVVPAIPDSAPAAPGVTAGGHTEPVRAGIHQHYFDNATPFAVAAGELLHAWVWVDPNDPPREVMLQWNIGGSWEHRAFWGWDLIAWGTPGNARRRIGGLPAAGEWVRLQVAPGDVGIAVGQPIRGMAFTLFDGAAAFAAAGAVRITSGTDATGAAIDTVVERAWFAGALPPAAQPQGSWQWLDARDLHAPTPSSRIGRVAVVHDLLADPLLSVLSEQERAQLTVRGLGPFVDYLRSRIDRADDLTDHGFVKMQTDIYRVRQLMLGSTDATRLAVSPALASIAKAETAVASQAQIASYVARIKAPVVGTRATSINAGGFAAIAGGIGVADAGTFSANLLGDALLSNATAIAVDAQRIPSLPTAFAAPKTPAKAPTAVQATMLQASFQPIYKANQFSPVDVVLSSPVVGKSAIRTTAIAERLRDSASQEARNYALATRHEAMLKLLQLAEAFTQEDGGMTPGLFEGFDVYGLKNDPFLADLNANTAPTAPGIRFRKLADLRFNATLVGRLLESPGRDSIDESTLFSESADLSDNTVALLRQLEGRIKRYRDALTRSEFALTELQNVQIGAVARMAAAGDRLDEARHDVGVARALIAEEQARLDAINARRAQVLAEEVQFIAFIRPREAQTTLPAPLRRIDPALAEAPVPACLRAHDDVPEELEQLLRVVREAPASWFVRLPKLIDRLDRSELLIRTLQSAQLRSALHVSRAVVAPGVAPVGRSRIAVAQLITGQQAQLANRFEALRSIDLRQSASLTWKGLRQQAEPLLSFGDLIDGEHGKGEVARSAAREFAEIGRVCACLHAEFSGVLPSIRLDWAELMSEFDRGPNLLNLRNAANLPRWSEIDSTDRRQMQAYIDWLFSQLANSEPQATALINDVVRICLLLASHAPVGRIVAGRLPRPVTGVRPGVRIPLVTLEPAARLRIGMQALLYRADQLVARAVVEDVGDGEVSARLLHTAAAQIDLGLDVRVHFDQAAVVSASVARLAARSR